MSRGDGLFLLRLLLYNLNELLFNFINFGHEIEAAFFTVNFGILSFFVLAVELFEFGFALKRANFKFFLVTIWVL